MNDLRERLLAIGLSDAEVPAKVALFERCAAALAGLGIDVAVDALCFFVPGRIEVLGKHTDYAGGRSLLCAMERGFAVVALPRNDRRIRAIEALGGATRELALDVTQPSSAAGDWSSYIAAVARSLARNFAAARYGVDIAFASDLPAASGMSSSSALVIAAFLSLEAANDLSTDPTYRSVITSQEVLGGYLGAVENGRSFGAFAGDLGVGTLGGSQDQTAILCCRAGMLSQYSFCPVRAEGEIVFPSNKAFVVAFSGAAAAKTANAMHLYNEASLAVSAIVNEWNRATNRTDECLAHAVSSSEDATDRIRALLATIKSPDFTPARLQSRFEQFVAEANDIIPKAADAFARDDMTALGDLVARSQKGAETLLGNQIPETIALVHLARANGAHAASAFGAGFGGSVWALVGTDAADQFVRDWRAAYARDFPEVAGNAEFFITRPGPAATRLD